MSLIQAAKDVLARWDSPQWEWGQGPTADLMEALRAAMAEAEKAEPVAWRYRYSDGYWRFSHGERINGCDPIESQALYAAPAAPARPLTTMAEQLIGVIAGVWHEHPDYSIRQTLDALNAMFPPAPARPLCDLCGSDDDVVAYCATHTREFVDREIARALRLEGYRAKAAPARPLTDEQIARIFDVTDSGKDKQWFLRFARAIKRAVRGEA